MSLFRPTYTFNNFWDFSFLHLIFAYINEKKSFLHNLIKTYKLYIFLENLCNHMVLQAY